jgi:hypothetical protein
MNEQLAALLLITSAFSGGLVRFASLVEVPKLQRLLWIESFLIAIPALMLAAINEANTPISTLLLMVGFFSGWRLHRRFSGLTRGKKP